MGAVAQLRPMGGVIILAIATSVFNSNTRGKLSDILGSVHGRDLLSNDIISGLDSDARERVRGILAHGYNLQMIVLCAFAAAQIPATLLMWRRKQIKV
jgi:hypothetical protein